VAKVKNSNSIFSAFRLACETSMPQCLTGRLINHLTQVCKIVHTSGVFRIWQKRGAWRARKARAYNGGLGAEPPVGSGSRAPSGVQGQSPGWGVRGAKPPEAETLLASKCSMETANSPIFLKFGNAKDHQTLLNFAILAGKWQKNAPCPP